MALDPHVKAEVKGAGWGLFWWTMAAALHAAVIGTIVFWEPLREWYLRRNDPKMSFAALEGDRMRQITRQMIDVHTRRIREKVKELHGLLLDLESRRDGRYATYVSQLQRSGRTPEPMDALGPAGGDVSAALDRLDIFQLYELAVAIEHKTIKTYRQMRIIELSRIQGLTFAEAAEVTNVAIPAHPEVRYLGWPAVYPPGTGPNQVINRSLFEMDIPTATDGRLAALKNDLHTMHAEVGAMISTVIRMIDVAKGLMGEDIGGITVVGVGGIFEGSGGGRWGSDIGPTLSPDEFFPGNRDGDFGENWRPAFGRKLMDDGRPAEWMYVDTWYIIGPFPNPNRQYMDKVFPPESVVDLDATYLGKDGRTLKWEWMKSPRLMIAPHLATNYAVWYAFTEVWSDRNQTKWVSFGSDDYSKAWLNGELVWTSGKTPHKWIPDRGFRKLNFRQGHNQLLLKLENAGGTTGYSVVIYTGSLNFTAPKGAD